MVQVRWRPRQPSFASPPVRAARAGWSGDPHPRFTGFEGVTSVPPNRPTLAHVARSAGVSVSTASLAFSGAGPIAAATRDRVLAAAAALGYRGPNALGRQLRSGRSGIVGVLIGDQLRRSFRDPVSIQMLDGLVSTLGPLGLGVLLIPGLSEDEPHRPDPLVESAAMDVAVLLCGANSRDANLLALQRRGIPMVVVESQPVPGVAAIDLDDRRGTAELGRYVRGLGHEQIATVTLPFDWRRRNGLASPARLAEVEWEPTRRRLRGLSDAGIDPVAVYETPASLVEHGAAAGRALLSLPDRPTAIIAQSDLLASGVVLAARELGLRVPQDVSVAGFDGVDLPWLAPDVLTSVRQPLAEKGAAMAHAAKTLLTGTVPEPVVLPVVLTVGTTTGPPPPH
jgi:DNA-binding LacI/PurR family transcriptional regulator